VLEQPQAALGSQHEGGSGERVRIHAAWRQHRYAGEGLRRAIAP
jgi:hypothetical protein